MIYIIWSFEEKVGSHPPVCNADLVPGFVQLITKIAKISFSIVIELRPAILPWPGKALEPVRSSIIALDQSIFNTKMEVDSPNIIFLEIKFEVFMGTGADIQGKVIIVFDEGRNLKLICKGDHLIDFCFEEVLGTDQDAIIGDR